MVVLFLVTAVAAYLPALSAGFIWDDPDYVVNNGNLRDWAGLVRTWTVPTSLPQWYPLTHTTFWVEYQLWGLWAPGYHATNVLLHGLGAYLLYLVLRRLPLPGKVAGLAALLWSLHPVQVESVAWVTERKNTLSFCLYAASFLFLLRWEDSEEKRVGSYIGALIFFAAALGSKTVTATLPAAFLLVCYCRTGKFSWKLAGKLAPFFVIGFAAGQVTAYLERTHVGATGPEWALSPVERTLIAGRAVAFYLGKLVAPLNLAFIYPRWTISSADGVQYLYPVGVVGLLVGLFVLRNRVGRGPFVAMAFFVGTLFPALGFFNVYPHRYSFVADHFQHLASVGPLVLAAVVLVRMPRLVPVMVLGGLMLLTFLQSQIYRDALTLWADTARKNPNSWMVHLNLGLAHHEAAQAAQTAAERTQHEQQRLASMLKARELGPTLPETHWNAGLALERGAGVAYPPDLQGAKEAFETAVSLDSNFVRAHVSLARLELAAGNTTRAQELTQHAVQVQPKFPLAHATLAQAILAASPQDAPTLDRAAQHLAAALSLEPNHADWRVQLARTVRQLALTVPDAAQRRQLLEAALGHYQLALRLSPPTPALQAEVQETQRLLVSP